MKVSIAKCDSYREEEIISALNEALAPLGGLDFVKCGMTVAIKANLVTFKHPDAAATTHPAMICALTKMLTKRGARVIIGDSPGGLYNHAFLNKVYSATGMTKATDIGGILNQNFESKNARFDEAAVAKTFTYTAWLDQADFIIDFCKLKSHGMMGMSGAAKNMFGVIPGTMKPEYHYRFPDPEDFANMIVDLDEYFKPCLSIADAVIGMEGNGPTSGTPRKIGAIIASNSPHALDLVCAKIIGIDQNAVPTLCTAIKRNLIPDNISKLEIIGDVSRFTIDDFKLVTNKRSLAFNSDLDSLYGKFSAEFCKKALTATPRLDSNECIGCGDCMRICPAKAITMEQKRPTIERDKCIRCFCCQEFCPKGAMKVHRPWIARLLIKNK